MISLNSMNRAFQLFLLFVVPVSMKGQSWQPVGVGVSSTHGLTLWDGKLAVAGSFSNPCNRIAAWDGTDYICMANGVGLVARDAISYNGDLVVIGDFWNTHQPCTGCNGIARWDGTAWQPMGTGFNNDVLSITIWNGDLIVGGDFTEADGNTVSRIARWNGSTWLPIGGTNDFSYDIRGLTVYNGELWAGGDFIDVAGNSSYDRVVKWNGSSWIGGSQIGLPNGISSTVRCFYVDAAQNKLYMGGHFLEVNGNTNGSGVAVYNGTAWSALGGGVNDYVRALTKYNGNIIVGGNFSTAGSVNANKIAKWNPNAQTWSAMGTGMNDYVKALEVYNGWLYAGGPFSSASGSSINGLARWLDGTSAAPVAAFTASSLSVCRGQCITLTDNSAGSPTSWTWTFPGGSPSGSSSQNPGSVCFNTTGSFTIKLKVCNASGCDSVTQTIVVNAPSVSAGSPVNVCSGQSTTLHATGAVSYLWSPAAGLNCTACASPVASPTSTTTYTVTGTSAAGCTNTSSVTVTVLSVPVANAGNDASVCAGESATLNASGGTSYLWSPSNGLSCTSCPSPIATPSSTTSYTVNVSNATGCSSSDVVIVSVQNLPSIVTGPAASLCQGETTALSATGGVSYSWSPAASLSCSSCATPLANPSVTTTYTVTGMGANGCTNTASVTVTVHALPTASAGSNAEICSGSGTTLSGSGGLSYLWSPSAGLSCTGCAQPVASPLTTTNYSLIVTDVNGCSASDLVTVVVNPLPVINAGNDETICYGNDVTLNPAGGISYSWSPPAGLSCISCEHPVADPLATTVYLLTGTDINGCSSTDSITVFVNPLPVADAGSDATLCLGESVTLHANGGIVFDWSPSAGLSCISCQDPVATPGTSIVYYVIVTDANSCSNSDSVLVTVNPLPVADAGNDTLLCLGESVTLNANGGIFYEWDPGTGLSCTSCQDPVATPGSTTTYTVTVTDVNGCSGQDDVTLTVLLCTSVEAAVEALTWTVYPNPVTENVTIQSTSTIEQVNLYNSMGGQVFRLDQIRKNNVDLFLPVLAEGVYFIQIKTEAGYFMRKISNSK